jgi:predicted transcriptional regulator YdeE
MDVTLESLGELRLVGIPVSGSREELGERVPRAWTELLARLPGVPNRGDPHVYYGASAPVGEDRYTYWVSAPVTAAGQVAAGLTTLVIPARTYAVATVRGDAEQITAVYLALGRWIASSGRRPAPDALGLERFDDRRQPPAPPYARYDYDVLRPLA